MGFRAGGRRVNERLRGASDTTASVAGPRVPYSIMFFSSVTIFARPVYRACRRPERDDRTVSGKTGSY